MFALAMGPAGFIAVLAGWITTETGRQPFTVYGLLRTVEFRLAAGGARGRLLADRLHHRLFRGVHRRRDLPPAPDGGSRRIPANRDRAATSLPAPPASRPPPARQPREPPDDPDRPSHHLGLHHRLCRVRLCRDGRLRSRPRHPVSAVSGESRSRRHHEQRRAGLGRQRNLAGARRRRHDGGVSAGLCGADAGALHADDRDAARAGVPRRRLRIPLAHARASATAGTSPLPAARCWRRWRRASRSAPSCRASMSRAGIMPAAGGTG